jgi:hypothetical protein
LKPFSKEKIEMTRQILPQKLSVSNQNRTFYDILENDMAKENSFDIVSKVDYAEVTNAINQTTKEVGQRFDFKGSRATVELEDKDLVLSAEDETKLRNMNDVLQSKLVKRNVPLKALTYEKIEPAAGSSVRQRVKIQQGIPGDKAKEIVKFIKDAKLKVQAAIQGDVVRISGKDRDTLQEVIAALKKQDFGIDMQFDNYRSN